MHRKDSFVKISTDRVILDIIWRGYNPTWQSMLQAILPSQLKPLRYSMLGLKDFTRREQSVRWAGFQGGMFVHNLQCLNLKEFLTSGWPS